jgi:DNA primase
MIQSSSSPVKPSSKLRKRKAPIQNRETIIDQPDPSTENSNPCIENPISSIQTPTSFSGELIVSASGSDVELIFDTRRYRIRGLENNHSPQQLRVNLLAVRDELVHLDTLDLYQARSRTSFIKATANELFLDQQIVKRDVGQLLLQLEQLQHQRFQQETKVAQPVEVSADQRSAAMQLLTDPQLIDRIVDDLDTIGLVGEETNKLIGYLACVSRRLEQPLALLIQSGSAAGKTTLMDGVLSLMPPEDQVRYSAMTGQSLYYLGQQSLQHKILAIAEEEGVAQASYALKLLQSDGQLTIAAVGKHRGTGRQSTETYTVQGPVMMFLTTTSAQPDAELQNRCLTLRVNESPEQTAEIHRRQRARYQASGFRSQTSGERSEASRDGDQASANATSANATSTDTSVNVVLRTRTAIQQLHHNAQRLLQSLPVVMPWADQLTFRHDQTRMRRDHAKYLSLIASITLLHQHQRRRVELADGSQAVEATVADVELANRLISEVMGQSLDDLLPQTRQLLVLIDDWVNQQSQQLKCGRNLIRFSQRQLRESLGWSDFQLRYHLARLVELEYVLVFRSGQGAGKLYQLIYDGQGRQGEPFMLGLADWERLGATREHKERKSDVHLSVKTKYPPVSSLQPPA